MSDAKIKVVIPFRDRGLDLRRGANLEVVMTWWWAHGFDPVIQSDGLEGDAPFNRHKAYNAAVAAFPETKVFIFTEADMLLPAQQILNAVWLAHKTPGLVVPFTQYRYLSDETTGKVRDCFADTTTEELADLLKAGWPMEVPPESVMDNGKSIGAVNVVSMETLEVTGGFTEATHGNWYDDNIIEEGFAFLTGEPTRHVEGPAVHLYHLPGWKGDHLSDEDKAATLHNKVLLQTMRGYMGQGRREWVQGLMSVRA